MRFDSSGKLVGINQSLIEFKQAPERKSNQELITSENLQFLKEEKKIENVFDKEYWSLYSEDIFLKPLKFSNGKTQEDVVKEIVSAIANGKKVIFLHGVCGTGKSAIALNIARVLGKTSIVVPVKALQKQYEKDYMNSKYVLKNERKLKIAMITGRENHDSIIEPGKSCADPFLPDTIKITEKNADKLKDYFRVNPFVDGDIVPDFKQLKRISIAPANPYWSPILPAEVEIKQLKDAKKKRFIGMNGREFIFYHRKSGCSYYDQYLSYFDSDVIIFNSAKYLAEVSLGRKPQTEVDIIDEADEFLDKFSTNVEINLSRLDSALKQIVPESLDVEDSIRKIRLLISFEETNKRALGIDEEKIFSLQESKILEILKLLTSNPNLEAEIQIDDLNYANHILESARDFLESVEETFLTYRKEEDFLLVRLVNLNLAKKFHEISEGSKALILMSGTLHTESVLKNIFGIENFVNIEAETLTQGSMEIQRVGEEFDCRYSSLQSIPDSREKYLKTLDKAVGKSEKPSLVHVNAYSDLPSEEEIQTFLLKNLTSKENLQAMQEQDKNGDLILEFKDGRKKILFTTKCSRGMDFPGDTCKSVIFTKYPNPNVKDTFWKILQKLHPDYYWDFYRDKAQREFLQRLYRAIRSKEDHIFVLSPDIRVLNAVRDLQKKSL